MDGRHGPQTSIGWDMGVYTHWVVYGNVGDGGDRGVYLSPPEHGRTVNCGLSYHGLFSSGRAESGTASIQEMVGSDCSGYTGDKVRAGSI